MIVGRIGGADQPVEIAVRSGNESIQAGGDEDGKPDARDCFSS